jgi:Alkylmercury lyase
MAIATKEAPAILAPVRAAKEIEVARLAQALRRLHDLLPLKERQQSLDKPLVEVHRAILRSLLDRGKPLTREEIAGRLGSKDAAAQAVALLGSYDLVVRNELTVRDAKTNEVVVLDAKGGEVVGAYPMTTEVTPHKLTVNGHSLYAMCAVDALAVGPMFNTETLIQSQCHVTGEPLSIHQKGKEILEAKPSNEVRVGVRWQRLIDCCAHVMCRQMVFLKDPATAIAWQSTDPLSIELFTLSEAIEFGEAFFQPLLAD